MHFVLECPAYCHIRARHPAVFFEGGRVYDDPSKHMLAIFAGHEQAALAACLYSMNHHRVTCLQRVDAVSSTQPETAVHLPHVDDDVELMRLGMLA